MTQPQSMSDALCEALAPQLSAYADNELWGSDREQVIRHLAECDVCRRTLARYRTMGETLREAMNTVTARDLSGITWPPHRALTSPRRAIYNPTRWRDPWPVLAGAVALIMLLIGLQILRPVTRPSNIAEIEQLDAADPVMVIPGDEERMTIIWVFDTGDRSESVDSGPT